MAIKEKNGKFYVSVYRRHPTTRKPVRAQKIVDTRYAAVWNSPEKVDSFSGGIYI